MNTVNSSSFTANPWLILGLVVIVLVVLWALSYWIKGSSSTKEPLLQEYYRLKSLFASMKQAGEAQASVQRDVIVQSDVWLDKVLLYYGIADKTTGDKLKSLKLKDRIYRSMLNELWTLHKLRNRVVHDTHLPTSSELQAALVTLDNIKRTFL